MTSECFPVNLSNEKDGIDFLSAYWAVANTSCELMPPSGIGNKQISVTGLCGCF